MMLRWYALLTWLIQPLLRGKIARRARLEPGYGEAIDERFGCYPQPAPAGPLLWLHAVSLGETRTAALLLPLLRQRLPGMRLLLTHSTATGRAEGRKLLLPGDIQVWLPWDSTAAVNRFFTHFQPRLGLLMETEVWPLLLNIAQTRRIPVLLINARLSEKSLRQAQRLAWLARPAYGALTAVLAQSEADAQRFRSLGANVAGVPGNIKFDATPDADQQAVGRAWQQALLQRGERVLLLASSREGEESAFFKAFSASNQAPDQQTRAQEAIDFVADEQVPRIRILVVPRHPQRFGEVAALAQQHGLKVSRRSDWTREGGPVGDEAALQADVWLGDSMGEMALYYSLASAALLGGSFAPLGGQNLMEAAACGCPVFMGPHTFNFAEAAVLAEAEGAAVRCPDMATALSAALAALALPAGQNQAGRLFVARHRGAVQRTVALVEDFLPGVL